MGAHDIVLIDVDPRDVDSLTGLPGPVWALWSIHIRSFELVELIESFDWLADGAVRAHIATRSRHILRGLT